MSVLHKLLLMPLHYGDEYDPNATGSGNPDTSQYSPENPPPGMVFDPNTGRFVPAPLGYYQNNPGGSDVVLPETGDKDGGTIDHGPVVTTAPPGTTNTQPTPNIYDAPLTKPYDKTFTPPPMIDQGGPPGLSYLPKDLSFADSAPGFPTLPKFEGPSVADAMNDPGYLLREQRGMAGIQNAAAAKGTLNDSSTFNALSDYNQDSASQEYQNLWGRKMNEYGTNLQSQYLLPYGASRDNWLSGTVNPGTLSYTTKAGAGQAQNQTNYTNAWNQFVGDRNYYSGWQNDVWNRLFQGATA